MAYKEKPFIDEEFGDELNAEKVVGGFLKGVLTVAGVALMAVIAGYSAGIAQENYRASRAKASGLDSARSQR
jgi:hypothetical protein